MGHGDGSGRIVSPDGADDSGTRILHVDMDAFYAGVEVLDDPNLRGLPVIIGAPDSRSVVSSASYEARRYGVRAAMPVSQAIRLCPTARIVLPRFERYQEVSRQVMAIFESITPLVEPLSVDEAFLDVQGVRRLWGSPASIATMIRERVRDEVGITCSVGVAATKHVAKMASTMAKPDGMLVVAASDTLDFLAPRPVRALWGVGPKAAEALESRGIRTVLDIRCSSQAMLDRAVGPALALRISQLARGEDSRAVDTERVEKSISHEETFDEDVTDRVFLRSELLRLADRVAARLRRAGWEASIVAIKVRFEDFRTVSRSQTLAEPTAVGQRIGESAQALFEQLDSRDPVRLLGVRAEKLRPACGGGIALWDDDEHWRLVENAVDSAAARFGASVVTRARHLGRGEGRGEGRGSAKHPKEYGLD
ncbi:MAG: DNA polymerase IV [Microbacterium sp.]